MQAEMDNHYQTHFKNAMNSALPDNERVHHLEFMRAMGIVKTMFDFKEEEILSQLKGGDYGDE